MFRGEFSKKPETFLEKNDGWLFEKIFQGTWFPDFYIFLPFDIAMDA